MTTRRDMLEGAELVVGLHGWGPEITGQVCVTWNGSATLNAWVKVGDEINDYGRHEVWQAVAVRTHYGNDNGDGMTVKQAKREAARYLRELERDEI